MPTRLAVCALVAFASQVNASVTHEVVFRVGDDAAIDWFEIDNPAVKGTLNVTNRPYTAGAILNGAAVDVSRNRLVFDDVSGTSSIGYAINLNALQLHPDAATPVTAVSIGTWDAAKVPSAGYRKSDGKVYYHAAQSDELRTLTFGSTGLITGSTSVGRLNGTLAPNAITGGDLDFSSTGSIWMTGGDGSGNSSLWNFNPSTLAITNAFTTSSLYEGITFNAAGDTLYGYQLSSGKYGTINLATGGFQNVLATNLTEFGVKGDLATGTLEITRLAGDANDDNHVNFDDLILLAQHYNLLTGQTYATGDFTSDGAVNFDDLIILAQHYNQTAAGVVAGDLSPTFASDWALAQSLVPEPTMLAAAGMLALAIGRRRR